MWVHKKMEGEEGFYKEQQKKWNIFGGGKKKKQKNLKDECAFSCTHI